MKFCHWDGLETDQENLQDLSTKISVLTIKNVCLTMKLERVLTMKIVDNFVRFGMPYVASSPRYKFAFRESLGTRLLLCSGTTPKSIIHMGYLIKCSSPMC